MVGRPIIDHAKIQLNDGWFEIEVLNNSPANKYVQEVKLNGNPLKEKSFSYSDIKAGSALQITMTDQKF
jgi:putative alpha-1,2-mannosidase